MIETLCYIVGGLVILYTIFSRWVDSIPEGYEDKHTGFHYGRKH